MLQAPVVSVVIPCHNAEVFLPRSVSSALGQMNVGLDLIAVDDGSTDESLAVLDGFGDACLRVIRQGCRTGVSAARNRGLSEARGRYVAFLDADDEWKPDTLARLVGALESEPDAVVAYCGWQNVGLPGGRGEPYVPPDYEEEGKWERLLRSCPWPIHAAVARTDVVRAVGGFDERLTHAEDYKLWLNVAARGTVVRVAEVLALYHFHGGNQASRDVAKAALSHLEVQEEFLKENPWVWKQLGRKKVRKLTLGYVRRRAFEAYWARDLIAARVLFRMLILRGFLKNKDFLYMLPALLPLSVHKMGLACLERTRRKG